MAIRDLTVSDRAVVAEALAANIEAKHVNDPILSALAPQLGAVSAEYSARQAARQELLRPYEEAVQRAKARRKKSDDDSTP